MTAIEGSLCDDFAFAGFCLLPSVYGEENVIRLAADLGNQINFDGQSEASIRNREGTVYAARNLIDVWPAVSRIWRVPAIETFLEQTLGSEFGLVRVLYFNKPPEQTWALPWHKDLTIAVKPPEAPIHFASHEAWGKLTTKAGVPHVEADCDVLQQMVTLRIHLDDADEENGALRVIPQSHQLGKTMDLGHSSHLVKARRGDVLAMRPLLSHCSGKSADGTNRHRRVLHLEFSGTRDLPHGFRWRDFITRYD